MLALAAAGGSQGGWSDTRHIRTIAGRHWQEADVPLDGCNESKTDTSLKMEPDWPNACNGWKADVTDRPQKGRS